MSTISDNLIAVHGRAGLIVPYTRFIDNNGTPLQVDISTFQLFIEIPAARMRKALVLDINDLQGLRILLTRPEVETLPDRPVPFIILDETGEVPVVDWEGQIVRVGYKGDPSA